MFSASWNRLWAMHYDVKDRIMFFVKPNTSKMSSSKQGRQETSNNNNGNQIGPPSSYSKSQLIGLFLGPILFILILLFFQPADLSKEGVAVLASTIWIATWWITEALPIPVTSLLPIVLFPLTQGLEINETASAYGDETVFLFMGGFMIALAMEKWNLHRRIALTIISIIGTNTDRIILGFMVATGFLSMWISNTATAMMMVPMGLAITYQVAEALKDTDIDTSKENFAFGKALMLGIAYSASLGGIATLIGTPPNTLLAGAVNKMYGIEISFAKWMLFGVPFAWVFIFLVWFYLVKMAFPLKLKTLPGGRNVFDKEREKLGIASTEEKLVLIIFCLAAISWITRTFLLSKFIDGLSDGLIAMAFAVVLFVIPAPSKPGDRLLDWNTAVKLPWGILLLFGGGLAIAAGFVATGLSEWFGSQLSGLQGVNLIVVIFIVAALVLALTEVTSNTATASMMYPIMGSLAVALGFHPYALMIAAGVAASCAFMLPVATPPNAVVFGSGYLRIPDMMKAGFALNVIGIFLVTLTIYYFIPLVWGIDLTVIPESFL